MPPPRASELLDELLEGNQLSPADLDDLMRNHPEENQYLDFKDGLLLQRDLVRARSTLKQYVAGFANAVGGVLVIGVDEPARNAAGRRPARTVSPPTRPGGQPLDDWAGRVLQPLGPYLSPPPYIQVVNHQQGEVLVIATARAPRLVPVVEEGQLVHYLRLHESTVKAADWLISDLVLGRRSHPTVELGVRVEGGELVNIQSTTGTLIVARRFYFILDITNASLVDADYVDAGVLTWGCSGTNAGRPHHDLLTYVDVGTAPGLGVPPGNPPAILDALPPWNVEHLPVDRALNRPVELRPYRDVRGTTVGGSYYPAGNDDRDDRPFEATLAVYVMPRGAPPAWFEVSFTYGRRGIPAATVKAINSGRPRVAWRQI